MVAVAQLVRAPDCGSGGRGFETHQPPIIKLIWFLLIFACSEYDGILFYQKGSAFQLQLLLFSNKDKLY